MVRPLRIELFGGLYHITSRGNKKEEIFLSDIDREKFLAVLGNACIKYRWICHAYCLMNNHYHLLIETPLGNLSKGMGYLNSVYTQKFNRFHNRVGHVLQGRYKAILVDKDNYLLELSRYIVLNPVRAGIVQTAEEWQWSSFLATSGKVLAPAWLRTDWILSLFSSNKSSAFIQYELFVYASEKSSNLWENLSHQLYLGSDEFICKVVSQIDSTIKLYDISRINAQALIENHTIEEFSYLSSNRDQAIYRSYNSGLYTMKEIGKYFGLHYSTISRIIKQIYEIEREGSD